MQYSSQRAGAILFKLEAAVNGTKSQEGISYSFEDFGINLVALFVTTEGTQISLTLKEKTGGVVNISSPLPPINYVSSVISEA